MTRNQIDYWRLQEDKRHQRETEKETERANRQASRDKRYAADVDAFVRNRQTIINNDHYLRMDTETNRHNVETERLQALAHQNELARITLGYDQMANSKEIANINAGVGYAGVGAQYANIAEMSRANQAREAQLAADLAEQIRHNQAGESVARLNVGYTGMNAATNARKQNLAETQWKEVGKKEGMQRIANLGSQTLLNWARTDLTETQRKLAPINTTINAVGATTDVITSLKGVNFNAKPKPGSVQWPDGSISSPR